MVVILEKIENIETGISHTSVNGYNYNPVRSTISNEVSDKSLTAYVMTKLYNDEIQSIEIHVSYEPLNFISFSI